LNKKGSNAMAVHPTKTNTAEAFCWSMHTSPIQVTGFLRSTY
jgi:hypothetical protein